jgi:hypothetical protein
MKETLQDWEIVGQSEDEMVLEREMVRLAYESSDL